MGIRITPSGSVHLGQKGASSNNGITMGVVPISKNRVRAVIGGGACVHPEIGLYTQEELDTMIYDNGWIPVASAEELADVRSELSQVMGLGTCWEGSYSNSLMSKYVQVRNVDFTGEPSWDTALLGTTGFVYDGNELLIDNISGTVGLFDFSIGAAAFNTRTTNATINNPSGNAYGLARLSSGGTLSNHEYSGTVTASQQASLISTVNLTTLLEDVDVNNIKSNITANGVTGASAFATNFIGSGGFRAIATDIDISGSATITSTTNSHGNFAGQAQNADITRVVTRADLNAVQDRMGGFIGLAIGGLNITDCYSWGDVTGRNAIGGFIGDISGAGVVVVNSYATGLVTSTGALHGGLCSRDLSGSAVFTDCYWDTDTTGEATSVGGTGQTTIALQTPISNTGIYANWTIPPWDFGTILDYPTLT